MCTRLSTYRPIRQGKGTIMLVKAEFEYAGKKYNFQRIIEDFDRNYNDEPYAYVCEVADGVFFEINILKDEEDDEYKLTEKDAYVVVYDETGEKMLECIPHTKVNVEFKE